MSDHDDGWIRRVGGPLGVAVTGEAGTGEAARLARECGAVAGAVRLARWIEEGPRPVTAGEVLRRADVPAAGAVLGVAVPARVRTAADVPALHVPWCTAVAVGLLRVGDGEVRSGPALANWPLDDEELLAGWLASLRAVCTAFSDTRSREGLSLLVLAMLVVLDTGGTGGTGGTGSGAELRSALDIALIDLGERYDRSFWSAWDAVYRFGPADELDPVKGLSALLAEFGAVTCGSSRPAITALGRWALARLRESLPEPVSPLLPATDLLARLAVFDREADRDQVAQRWLAARTVAGAAEQILAAADESSPALRLLAVGFVESFGDDVLPAWREMARAPRVGPYARAVLAAYDELPELSEADQCWLAADGAAAALARLGPDEALTQISEALAGPDLDSRLARVRASGHPDAENLASSLAEFIASGAPRSVDQVLQVKIRLTGWSPAIWRRVLVPATITLGDLHAVIQILYGWDGDHLHEFAVGEERYSDPFFDLEETADEEDMRLGDGFGPSVKKIVYTYDFGSCWTHEITLEQRVQRQHGQAYPVCVAYRGDSPVEYWDEDNPSDPEPFGLADVNKWLAALSEPDRPE